MAQVSGQSCGHPPKNAVRRGCSFMNTSQLIAPFAGADLDQPTKAARVLSIEFCARWQTLALYSAKKKPRRKRGLRRCLRASATPGWLLLSAAIGLPSRRVVAWLPGEAL